MTENLTVFGWNPYSVEIVQVQNSKKLKGRWTNYPDSDSGCLPVGDDKEETDFLWSQTVVVPDHDGGRRK
jgi:hypothetical protein